MKPCPNCRSEAPNDAEVCIICGWDFASGMRLEMPHTAKKPVALLAPRPTGKTAIEIALILGASSVVLMLISFFITTDQYGEIRFDSVALQWTLQIIAGAIFHSAMIIGLVGYIVRAISYLPGSDTKRK